MKPSKGSSRPLSPGTFLTAIAIVLACGVVFCLLYFTEVGNKMALNVLSGFAFPILLVLASFWMYLASRKSRLHVVYLVLLILYAAGLVCFLTLTEIGRELWSNVVNALMVLAAVLIVSVIIYHFSPASIRDRIEKARKEARRLFENVILQLVAVIAVLFVNLFKNVPRGVQITVILVLALAFLAPIGATVIWPAPRLVLDPETVDFTRKDDLLPLRLTSSSDRHDIEWEIDIPSYASDWLLVDKISGTASRNGETIQLSVLRHNLSCESQEIRLTIQHSGWRKEDVTVKVDNTIALDVSDGDIEFGPNDTSKTLDIANEGAGYLCFSYAGIEDYEGNSEDENALDDCIAVSPRSLSCGPRDVGGCEISVNRHNLQRRLMPYVGKFTFYVGCCGGELELDSRFIKVYHPPPQISIQPNPLVVDPKLMEGNQVTITLKNTGDVTAAWRFSENGAGGWAEWISEISPRLGNLDVKESVVVRITVDPCSLPSEPETQELRILLSDKGGEIPLICDLRPARPVIDVRPTQLDIGSEKSGSLTVNNVGCGSLHWQATWEDVNPADDKDPKDGIPDWIECLEPPSGRCVEGDDPDMVVVRVKRADMSLGQRTATLRLSQEGMESDFQTVDISIEVEPELAISLSKLPFGYLKQSLSFMVKNVGSGTLFWEIKPPDTPWLQLTRLKALATRVIRAELRSQSTARNSLRKKTAQPYSLYPRKVVSNRK